MQTTTARAHIGDVIASLSVAGLLVPECVAYAAIAGLPSQTAIIAGIVGGFAYALAGRSRFAIVSPTSSSAALLAAALASLGANPSDRLVMSAAMVGLVGVFFVALALFRLGGLASFVSRPVLRGFALGIAVTIIIKQLPKLLGVAAPHGGIAAIIAAIARQAGAIHPLSLILGAGALAALMAFRRYPRLPGAAIVLLAGIALSDLFDLPALGVASAGQVALAMPNLHFLTASADRWAELFKLAAPLALILFAESWGTIRTMALRHGDAVSANHELAALGLANLASAALQGMPVGAGFSVGSANESAGAQSRVAALLAAAALLMLGLFAGHWLAQIPEPVLGAVVIAALTHALSPGPIIRLFQIGRDQWIAVAAFLAVLILGVLNGMVVAVALSIASLLHRFSHPAISRLGRTGDDGHDFVDLAQHPEASAVPGVAIFRPNAPLFFANADASLGAIANAALASPARAIVLSLEQTNDLDSTAVEVLGEFERQMANHGKRVVLARAHDMVRAVLREAGFAELANSATYSVDDAVERAIGEQEKWP
jgi:MFS superfamily sulfate permease-like transporter